MKINFFTISKPNFEYATLAFDLYLKRLRFYHNVNVVHLKNSVTDKEFCLK